MTDIKKILFYQEKKYDFPYHFLPIMENNNYKHARYLPDGYEYLSYIQKVIDYLENIDFNNLLDVGCGDGRFLFECFLKFKEKKFIGIDMSDKAIKFAKIFNPGIIFFTDDFIKMPVDDFKHSIDVVTLIEVLEHIDPGKISKILENIYFVLKNKGKLLLTVPSKNIKLIKKHFQHFYLSDLSRLLGNHFKIKEHCYLNKISIQEKIIRRLFSNRLFILNHKGILNLLFNYYRKNILEANETNAKRILLICEKV